jgi:hypothetical protein
VKRSASMRYLGVEVGVPPRSLLGLPDGPLTAAEVESALARQQARIDRHPSGREPEAEDLRRDLNAAAHALRSELLRPPPAATVPSPAPSPPPPPVRDERPRPSVAEAELTDFDRLVLATLATEGGWNAASRARLVAIAARFGVSGEGLVKVVEGIQRNARSGAFRRRPDRVAGAVAELAALRSADESRLARTGADGAFAREMRGESPSSLLRLTLVFVAITAAALWFLGHALTANERVRPPRAPTAAEVAERERLETPPEVPAAPRVDPTRPSPVRWSRRPTLAGGTPPEGSMAAAAAPGPILERLARLARKNELAPGRPAEVDRKEWALLVAEVAGCWPLLDPAVRTETVEAVLSVLRPLEDDRVAEEFLAALAVEPKQVLRGALGPWRGSFAAGILAECAARGSMPPAIAAAAADRLVAAVPRKVLAAERGGTPAFELGATAWLDRAVRELVAMTAGDPAAPDRWERWLEAGRRLRGDAAVERSVLEAIDAALRDPRLDPVPDGEGSDLLGRLVDEVDWTSRSPVRAESRTALARWFADGSIPPSRLWALTSLLDLDADAAWFVPELIVPPKADLGARQEVLTRILAAWPESRPTLASGGGIPVEPRLLERWRVARTKVEQLPANDEFGRLRAVVAASWLSGIGTAIEAGQPEAADELFGELDETFAADAVALARGGLVAGVTAGNDGEFNALFQAAGRDLERQREQLRNLRMRVAAGDLGPIDAAALVKETFFASDPGVRSLAQDVAGERFPNGITVLTEILDQLPSAPRSESNSVFLQKLTGSMLPETRDRDWMRAARHALVRKILRLERSGGLAIDALAERYAQSIDVRARLLATGYEPPTGAAAPDAALASLSRQWRGRAGTLFLSDPFPAPLDELDRRREVRRTLADGPIRRCAAESLSLLELVAAVAVAEEPPIRSRVAEVLAAVAERRARAGSALGQLLESELGIAATLDLRFRPAGAEDEVPPGTGAEGGEA